MVSPIPNRKEQRTVKAFGSDIDFINEQAKLLNCTAAEAIHMMCEEKRRQMYLEELGESFDLLKENKEAFAKGRAENSAWDCTIADGLPDAS